MCQLPQQNSLFYPLFRKYGQNHSLSLVTKTNQSQPHQLKYKELTRTIEIQKASHIIIIMLRKQSPYITNASKPKKKQSKKKVTTPAYNIFGSNKPLDSFKIVPKKEVKSMTTRVRDHHLKVAKKVKTEPTMAYERISRLTSPDFIKSVTNTIVLAIQEEGVEGAWNNQSEDNSLQCKKSSSSPQQSFLFNKTWNFSLSSTKSQKVISKKCELISIPQSIYPTFFSARSNEEPYLPPMYYGIPNSNSFPYYLPAQPQPEVEDYTVRESNILADTRTTVYIRHIPNKYTLKMIEQQIDATHKERYNFLHLPFDYDNNCNRGYAFINFLSSEDLKRFYQIYQGRKWKHFKSEKRCEIKYACVQGKEALVDHFYNTKVFNHTDDKLRPIFRDAFGKTPRTQADVHL